MIKVSIKDCVFAIAKYEPDDQNWWAAIVPQTYFEKHRHIIDQHISFMEPLNDWTSVEEGVFEHASLNADVMFKSLISHGCHFSAELTAFLEQKAHLVYHPTVYNIRAQEIISRKAPIDLVFAGEQLADHVIALVGEHVTSEVNIDLTSLRPEWLVSPLFNKFFSKLAANNLHSLIQTVKWITNFPFQQDNIQHFANKFQISIAETQRKETPVRVWGSPVTLADGCVRISWWLTEEKAIDDQNKWEIPEPCHFPVDTYLGSDIHKEAK